MSKVPMKECLWEHRGEKLRAHAARRINMEQGGMLIRKNASRSEKGHIYIACINPAMHRSRCVNTGKLPSQRVCLAALSSYASEEPDAQSASQDSNLRRMRIWPTPGVTSFAQRAATLGGNALMERGSGDAHQSIPGWCVASPM